MRDIKPIVFASDLCGTSILAILMSMFHLQITLESL